MKKVLDGNELQGFIKQRQAQQIRKLEFKPRLSILVVGDDQVSNFYTKVKQNYGQDIGVGVELINLDSADALQQRISVLNQDATVHGVMVQLPIQEVNDPSAILNLIDPEKDIDGLGIESSYESATVMAILFLLHGYNIELQQGRKIVIVGLGRLVGKPLYKLMQHSGYNVEAVDENTVNKDEIIRQADVLISAVGQPGIITSDLVAKNCVIIDAGTSSVNGTQQGDVAAEVYERPDITATPPGGKGGVGPLTVAALFDNLIQAATRTGK